MTDLYTLKIFCFQKRHLLYSYSALYVNKKVNIYVPSYNILTTHISSHGGTQERLSSYLRDLSQILRVPFNTKSRRTYLLSCLSKHSSAFTAYPSWHHRKKSCHWKRDPIQRLHLRLQKRTWLKFRWWWLKRGCPYLMLLFGEPRHASTHVSVTVEHYF